MDTQPRPAALLAQLTDATSTRRDVVVRGRWPVTAVFFLNGLTLATYIVLLPSLKAAYQLSNGQLGVIGMLFALAALVSMQFVGRLVARYGSARIIRLALVVMPITLGGIGIADSRVAYTAAAVLLGAVHGTVDVAMNAHAVAVERRLRRPILSGCHAAWSISAVVASVTGAALIKTGTSPTAHLVGVAIVLIIAGLALGPLLAPPAADVSTARPVQRARRNGWRDGWTRTVLGLGITGTVLMICEGAALGWSGIFLHDSRGATLAVASTAVMAFTGCQTAGRVIGDRLRLIYGDRALFRAGALIGTAGLALAVFGSDPATAIAGFAVVGLGTSVLIPLTFSAVGHAADGDHGAATFLSRFTTFTYAGILLGPALIGWVAQAVGLQWTLAALIPMLGCVALVSRLPERPTPAGAHPTTGSPTL